MVDRAKPFGYYSIHFSRWEGVSLKKFIYLILFFFLSSGCGGMHKFSKGAADASLPLFQAGPASIVIPESLEMPVFVPQTPLETRSNNQFEADPDFLAKEESFSPWDFSLLFTSIDEAESENSSQPTEEIPALLAENTPPQTDGILPVEKKRISSAQKPSRPGGRPAGNEPSFGDLRAKKTTERPPSEFPSAPPFPAAGSFLSISDFPEAASRFRDLLPQPEEKAESRAFSRESSLELSEAETKTAIPSAAVHAFPSLLNDKVQEFISFFQGRAESFFTRSLARSQAYEEMMKRIFREKNLPEELFYLALIESGYNPTALSRAKASGIWQFIGQTAKRFGLRVDKWVDERRDPEKSTLAAAEYLKTLHGMFNNWDLAAASYNAGEGKVLTAMKKAKSDDFWEISNHRFLKQETKKYVPMFLAAMTIAKEPQKYGFSNIEYHPPLVYEKAAVPPSTSLAIIAKAAETDLSEIRSLNPALLREKTPPNLPHFEINLPSGKKEVFERNFPSLTRSSASKNAYRVSSGDTLSRLAKKFNVSVQELCGANALTPQTLLKPGSILKIPQ
jgi:hypothetical protein